MNIVIRAATLNDAARLARLHAECFVQNWNAAAFTSLLTESANFALLAGPTANHCESFVLARTAADEAEILTLVTAAQMRRQGLARALVRAAAAEATARSAGEIFLEVGVDNVAARALYRRLGFAETGVRPGYYQGLDGKSADALTLRARLPLSL